MKKNPHYNHLQLKHLLKMSNNDMEFLEEQLDENLSVEEFQKKIVAAPTKKPSTAT